MKYRIIKYADNTYIVQFQVAWFDKWDSFATEHKTLEEAEVSMQDWLNLDSERIYKRDLKKKFKIIKIEKV